MIKTTKRGVEVSGNRSTLLMELTNIMRCLYENDVVKEEDLLDCVALSTMSIEELQDCCNKRKEDMFKDLLDFVDKIADMREHNVLDKDDIDEIFSILHDKEKDDE